MLVQKIWHDEFMGLCLAEILISLQEKFIPHFIQSVLNPKLFQQLAQMGIIYHMG